MVIQCIFVGIDFYNFLKKVLLKGPLLKNFGDQKNLRMGRSLLRLLIIHNSAAVNIFFGALFCFAGSVSETTLVRFLISFLLRGASMVLE